jgi:hypothetical protein
MQLVRTSRKSGSSEFPGCEGATAEAVVSLRVSEADVLQDR